MPLSAGAMAVLERLRFGVDGNELLFPSPLRAAPLAATAKPVQRIRDRSGVEFQLRDIRRTVRTRLREMGAPQDVSEAILSFPRTAATDPNLRPLPACPGDVSCA